MKSNNLVTKSKINTHSLKAANFMFLVRDYDSDNNYEIVHVPMDVIISEGFDHQGMHFLVYVMDVEEVMNNIVVTKEELESVVAQIRIELGGAPVEMIGVVYE